MTGAELRKRVREIVAAAEADGVALDDGNVVDLLADQMPRVPLAELRAALVDAGLAPRFPKAVARGARLDR
ncbi:MAG: hypothetical protein DCC71_15385 [Proteobacteria bacterium]|nr:MAG: hypothetical protein DCC71_15385 [Pseudomonadota bacterium]